MDYFRHQRKLVPETHTIFDWEKTHRFGNLEKLLNQLCYDIGFPNFDPKFVPLYFSGELSELLDFFPEMKYYRDIVYTFKYMMAPTSDSFPPVRPWVQKSARLKWKYQGKKEGFLIRAFSQNLEIDVSFLFFLSFKNKSGRDEKEIERRMDFLNFLIFFHSCHSLRKKMEVENQKVSCLLSLLSSLLKIECLRVVQIRGFLSFFFPFPFLFFSISPLLLSFFSKSLIIQ